MNYLEPAFRGKKIADWQTQRFEPALCPVAERLQPRLLQFKTNYFDPARREKAAEAMRKTISFFSRPS
jgi:perosamine synthetase